MRHNLPIAFLMFGVLMFGCTAQKKSLVLKHDLLQTIDQNFRTAAVQYKGMKGRLPAGRFPRTYYEKTGRFQTAGSGDWVSGFYPGTLLYLYAQTKDTALLTEAERMLNVLEKEKNNKSTHDLGFMMFCSFGNAEAIAPKQEYKEILVTSAKSLSTRFNPTVGCIKSWDRVRSLDGKTELTYPVIIDNMMNLELLFYASKVTGDPSFRDIALRHARTTMKNHLRPDYSSYHVVNYDAETGAVKSRETHQGFADNSTWARGQAWGIYGFTLVYRESKEKAFLETAEKMADFFLAHLPNDTIPDWDFNVNQPGYEPKWNYDPAKFPGVPKDASAGAVAASALIELSGYVGGRQGEKYLKAAEDLLTALSSPKYKAAIGENGNFLLKHSTGNAPAYSEIDVPLTYADYYFVEAMKRYKALKK
ncbi:MAG TPA: glycoside hydrolase family 88 protein [Flavisolibacter sp.]|nr:glycoside hydrolase family 88 protein [Flavisolibacter sp.]